MNKGIVLGLLMVLSASSAFAEPVDYDRAIHALIGEAGGQGEDELQAHACALRNRGSLRGVYGVHADIRNRGQKARHRAVIAWNRACGGLDTVNGATHWLSDYDLAHSRPALIAWRHKAVYRVKVGSTWFYRLK